MEERIFAKGYCFTKIFIFFLLGCILGTYYEEVLNFIKFGTYSNRQGLLYGPFSPIYGLGVSIFVIFLGKKNGERGYIKTLLFASLIGGITEFMTSWIAEVVFHIEFWNYSGYFLNILGRTTIPFMIGWGIGGTMLMKFIYPSLSKWIERIPYKVAQPVYRIIFLCITVDIIVTYTAFGRMALRNNGIEPVTFIGEWMDHTFDDEYMYHKFPVMAPIEEVEHQ